eukprot:Sspe_Gene.22902::Locus_8798_Transcript_1_1_Confidence_1.000_Length_2907::g.22902::m.22902/K16510/RPS6KA4, MSK2; ribosomal protein S6 kinase alpha-4
MAVAGERAGVDGGHPGLVQVFYDPCVGTRPRRGPQLNGMFYPSAKPTSPISTAIPTERVTEGLCPWPTAPSGHGQELTASSSSSNTSSSSSATSTSSASLSPPLSPFPTSESMPTTDVSPSGTFQLPVSEQCRPRCGAMAPMQTRVRGRAGGAVALRITPRPRSAPQVAIKLNTAEGSIDVIDDFFVPCPDSPNTSVHSSFAGSGAKQIDRTITDSPESCSGTPHQSNTMNTMNTMTSQSIAPHTTEVVLEKNPVEHIGLQFESCESLQIVKVVEGSPAARFGAHHFIGRYLTHIANNAVFTIHDVITHSTGATVLTLQLMELSTLHLGDAEHSGWLEKRGEGIIKLYRRRWCELHGRFLNYALMPGDKAHGRIDLAGATVEVSESEGRDHSFEIKGPHLPRTYELAADSEEERNEWVRRLAKVAQRYEAAPPEVLEDWLEGLVPPNDRTLSLSDFELHQVVGTGSFAKVIKVKLKKKGGDVHKDFERQRWLRDGLRTFYQKHRPDRLKGVDTIVARSLGREDTLYERLLSRYPDEAEDLTWLRQPPQPREARDEGEGDGQVYAMKVVKKSALPSVRVARMMMAEKAILQSVKHPYIVRLHYAFQTTSKLCLIMTYLGGGDLRSHLTKERRFPEARVRFYTAQIMLALDHLHAHGIVYRDLKPQNVVLDSDGHAVLTDLGLATDIGERESRRAYTFCGTPQYVAPEVLQSADGYTKAVDFWALGVMVFEMLVGATPFQAGDSMADMFVRIMEESVRFPGLVSRPARELVASCLEREPQKRLSTLAAARPLKFFKGLSWGDLRARKIPPPFRPSEPNGVFQGPVSDLQNQSDSVQHEALEEEFKGFTYTDHTEGQWRIGRKDEGAVTKTPIA